MKNLKHNCLLGLLIFLSLSVFAEKLQVRIYTGKNIQSVQLSTRNRPFELISEDSTLAIIPENSNLLIALTDSSLIVQYDSLSLNVLSLFMQSDSLSDGFFIKAENVDKSARAYQGNLSIRFVNHQIQLVNSVELEDYVAAVVEAEGGYGAKIEYYKTQAVICRTYALRNLHRHESEGFQLCDLTHCQVYKGKAMTHEIIEATKATESRVIVDENFQLINAVYHSNSGGQTANSIDVWTSQLPYLVAVKDTFSLEGKHAYWERRISRTEWRIFLENRGVPADSLSDEELVRRYNSRIAALKFSGVSIPAREFRRYFSLKSAFFDVIQEGEEIVLQGKGYGHGVGLAQEGAMKMAEAGYDYKEIIQHYFTGTRIVNLSLLHVFEGLGKVSE